ncbi:dTDP-glucose 4,6-dehydratase [Halonatronum saccharophilum]|uniref:dTDP-glucose 4,6-dehydratase n=1 Tax=Halonatronum saccharophilum TaxID=150060 RepID=UPI0004B79A08|nr:dTDP-glucose 4,6-dehydratase [Halonatronum saccharophilum]
MTQILVTGGAGFIGSNFINYLMDKHPDYKIINLDKLTYAGSLDNLKEVADNPNYHFIKGDIANKELIEDIFTNNQIDHLINFAAESHVDRSIENSAPFLHTNVLGPQVLLDVAKDKGIKRYIQISTDEVYGSLGEEGSFTEDSPLKPNNPYSATKASADLIVRAYNKTYGLPTIITRSSNNYGPKQYQEKLIPLFITKALRSEKLPLYGDGTNIRDWLYVQDNCRAIDLVLHQGRIGGIYNIGGDCEKTNLEVTELILDLVGKDKSLIEYIDDRPGHDYRYSLDSSKIKTELGWEPRYDFTEGLKKTINSMLKI